MTWPEYRALSCKLASVSSAPEAPPTPSPGGVRVTSGEDHLSDEGRLSEEAVGSLFQLCRERRLVSGESNRPSASEDSGQVHMAIGNERGMDRGGWIRVSEVRGEEGRHSHACRCQCASRIASCVQGKSEWRP